MRPRKVALLGATGSIGRQAVEIVKHSPELELCAVMSASQPLDQVVAEHHCRHSQVGGSAIPLLEASNPDVVLNAIVGFAGVDATLWALEHGVTLALARVHPPVAALWRRAGLSDDVVAGTFESVAAAVATLQARAGRGTTA